MQQGYIPTPGITTKRDPLIHNQAGGKGLNFLVRSTPLHPLRYESSKGRHGILWHLSGTCHSHYAWRRRRWGGGGEGGEGEVSNGTAVSKANMRGITSQFDIVSPTLEGAAERERL